MRLRQVRVARDSCVDRRSVGTYTVPATEFAAVARDAGGGIGAMGSSQLQTWYLLTNQTFAQPGAVANGTVANSDGGPSASSQRMYPYGCMNWWAVRGNCPADEDTASASARVVINTNPAASITTSFNAARRGITVKLEGRMRCAWRTLPVGVAQSVFEAHNPAVGISFWSALRNDTGDPATVNACVGRYDTLDGTCWDDYSSADEQVTPFVGATGTVYRYSPNAAADSLLGQFGFGPQTGYGRGGFLVGLSNDAVTAARTIQQVVWDKFLDRGTRAMVLDFNVWNANTRFLSSVRIVVEFFSSGYTTKYSRIYTYRVVDGSVAENLSTYTFTLLFFAFWVYFCYKEFQRAWFSYSLASYLGSFRNLYVVSERPRVYAPAPSAMLVPPPAATPPFVTQMTLLVLDGVYLFSWVHYLLVLRLYDQVVANYASQTYLDM